MPGRRVGIGVFCALCVGALTALLRAQAAPPAPAWSTPVDRVFAQWDRPDSPGCALGVYQDGRIAYARGYGIADLEHNVPITPDSVFYAGSVSKQFTAMAAALAIAQGKLSADDDVRKYVPELPDYGRTITIRHLVHHTSGLRDVNTLMGLAGRRDGDAFDNDAVLRILARQNALNFMPGDEHLYSNSGYAMLALAIERATGAPFAEYADANIFKPLGMPVSHFHTDLTRLVPGRAWAYDRRADLSSTAGRWADTGPTSSGSGARTRRWRCCATCPTSARAPSSGAWPSGCSPGGSRFRRPRPRRLRPYGCRQVWGTSTKVTS